MALLLVLIAPEAERIVVLLVLILLARLLLILLLRLLLAVGLRIFDLVVGVVDLVHLLRGGGIIGVEVRVVFFRQCAICLPNFIFRCVLRYAEHLIGVFIQWNPSSTP